MVKIEQRVKDQIARHRGVGSTIGRGQIIEIQMKQERERLINLAERYDDEDKGELAEACWKLVDEWLPYLERELKRGYF